MTAATQLFGILLERGHAPDPLPEGLQALQALFAAKSTRYAASIATADGSLAVAAAGHSVALVMVPCAALEHLLGVTASWTAWIGPEGQAEIAKIAE